MRHSSCLVCVLCILAGAASMSKANAQKTWTPVALLKEGEGYPFSFGDPTDTGSAGSQGEEQRYNGYTSSVSLSRSANSQSTIQSIRADEARYTVTWTLSGAGDTSSLSVISRSTTSASVYSGASSGQDIATVAITGVAENSATTIGLHAGQSDGHAVPWQEEIVTKNGQVTCSSQVHPAASVSKPGQSFYAGAEFVWIASEDLPVMPGGPDS